MTRLEIAESVGFALDDAPVDKHDLTRAAGSFGARPEVPQVLEQLPPVRFRPLRDLWPHLGVTPMAEPLT